MKTNTSEEKAEMNVWEGDGSEFPTAAIFSDRFISALTLTEHEMKLRKSIWPFRLARCIEVLNGKDRYFFLCGKLKKLGLRINCSVLLGISIIGIFLDFGPKRLK